MKTALNLLLCLCLMSCVAATGSAERWTYVSLGTDAKGLNVSNSGMSGDLNQSRAAKTAGETITTLARLRGWFGLANTATSELGDLGEKLTD